MEKLVRDRIPEIMESQNKPGTFYTASDDNVFYKFLKKKLVEEVEEFLKEDSIEELADIYEVLEAIQVHKKYSFDDLKKIKHIKKETRGGFLKKRILKMEIN